MEMEILPLGDRLKVLPLVPRATTRNGILMPEATAERERPMEGVVLALGRGRALESGAVVPLECQLGDVVQFGKYAGIHVFDEAVGHDVLLMREDEALGRKLVSSVNRVHHDDYPTLHVAGDPRCATCRAGGVGATSSSTR